MDSKANGSSLIPDVLLPVPKVNAKHQIIFSWDNVSVAVLEKSKIPCGQSVATKTILSNATGYAKPGELLAIFGASGAGKSTLLNALTFRNMDGFKVTSGARYANGIPVGPNSLTALSAYVQQEDLFIGTLTVTEHLLFQAMVRMDSHIPYRERVARVKDVLEELGLTKCKDALIGIPGRLKGISGGEQKRLAFASEVLTDPPLMFCDEPTSGLDSYMAKNVIEVLKEMARKGKTLVVTMHQPSSQVFALFDKVMLMAEGKVAFLGGIDLAQQLFSRAGFPCPLNYNPADHFVEVLSINPDEEELCRKRVEFICSEFKVMPEGGDMIKERINYYVDEADVTSQLNDIITTKGSPYKASGWEQFKALLWRSWLTIIKEPLIIKVRFAQTIITALTFGLIYMDQDYDQKGIMNINGVLFLVITATTFQNIIAVLNVFCMELPLFLREHFNGMYRTDIYFLCKQLAELPVYIIVPLLFVPTFYFMVGLNPDASRFLICCLVTLILTQTVVGFGYLISCSVRNIQMALAIAPAFIMPLLIVGGFFMNKQSIPSWLSWLKYLSWFMYANELLLVNQWEGVVIDCPTFNSSMASMNETGVPNTNVSSQPCISTGEGVIEMYGMDKDQFYFNILMLLALAVGFRFLGFLLLLGKTFRKNE